MKNQKLFQNLGLIVLVILGVTLLVYLVINLLNNGGVNLSIIGPDTLKAGEIGQFQFQYSNNSRVALEDCSLEIRLGEGVALSDNPAKKTIDFNIGEILANNSNTQTLSLMLLGGSQSARNIEAVLTYRPKGLSSSFTKDVVKTVLLNGSSFNLEVKVPNKVFIDQTFPLEINWANLSNESFDNLELRTDWPTGFSFESSNPDVTKERGSNNKWTIGSVSASGQGKITVNGSLSGQDGESKKIVFTLGTNQNGNFLPLAQTEGLINLINNPLQLSVFVNGDTNYNANLGDELDFTINYLNNYSSSLRDLTVKVQLNGDVFDFSTLKAPSGIFSSRLQTITWTGARVKDLYVLNPSQNGTLNFSVNLKKSWSMQSLAQKNIVLEVKTTIESASVPEELGYQGLPRAQAIDTVKLNSDCSLSIGSYFWDVPSQIANTGKLPLKAGEPTDFTIHWKIINTYNTLNNITIQTTLPLWVDWTNQIAGNYGDYPPSYDPRTRQITWSLPSIPVGVGSVLKPYEAIFQIRVTPLSSQVNQGIDLTNETTFQATDAFTLSNINLTYPGVNSLKITDPAMPYNGGLVRP
ncbi:MAG: hypothetical protein ACP5RX_00755 [Minisyncoccia bacterium]